MLWQYPEFDTNSDVTRRTSTVERIDAWWQAFESKTEDLRALFEQRIQWDLPSRINKHLHDIGVKLYWEFGPGRHGGQHRLVITPEAESSLRPIVDEMIRRAPIIDDWEFYAYRLQETMSVAVAACQARCGGSIADCQVQMKKGSATVLI